MEKDFEEILKKIKTKEELIFFLEKIKRERLEKEKFFPGLEKRLQSLPEIRLEIAFSPEEDFINRVSQWLEKELGQKIILDIIVNPKVVAGAIIEYKGRWYDFSIGKKIDELFIKELTS